MNLDLDGTAGTQRLHKVDEQHESVPAEVNEGIRNKSSQGYAVALDETKGDHSGSWVPLDQQHVDVGLHTQDKGA